MRWSLYVGKVSGIKLFLHWTFIVFLVWIVVNALRNGSSGDQLFYLIMFVLSVFACITLHEFGHALMAKRYNYKTRDITLLPIGGMARMEEIPENPSHELAVAIAGPAVNVVIAAILAPFVFSNGFVPTQINTELESGQAFLYNLFTVNLWLALFNLIPAFPMDGGRILRAIITLITGNRLRATNIAATIGKISAVIFFILGAFFNFFLSIIGVFIFLMAHSESELVKSKAFLHDFRVSDVIMRRFYTLNIYDRISDAVKLLLDVQVTDFLVMDGDRIAGTLSRDNIIQALATRGADSNVREAMNAEVKVLTPDLHLDTVYQQVLSNGNTIMPVVENGKLIGVIDSNNILEFIMVRSAQQNYKWT